jgi:cytochrome c oxidase subunit 3
MNLSSTSASPRPSAGTTAKLGLVMALATESVFFATLIAAYVALRAQTGWPIDRSISNLAAPIVNTGILLVSTWTATQSHLNIRKGNSTALQNWLVITLLLGLLFVAGQIYDFKHAGMKVNDQAFGGVFFTLMTFHALHVLAGVVILALNTVRSHWGDFTQQRHTAIEIGTWFWYYVAAVWVVLFVALYIA